MFMKLRAECLSELWVNIISKEDNGLEIHDMNLLRAGTDHCGMLFHIHIFKV